MLAIWLLLLASPSPHADALAEHRGTVAVAKPIRLFGLEREPRVKRIVYGYYPYWVTAWEELRWDLLTHIAYFAIEIDSTGTIEARHGWPDMGFVQTAHAAGVRVDLTFTLFSGTGIRNLTCSATTRATTIATMIDEMEAGDADGINIDFEGLISGTRDCFTSFIAELRQGLIDRGHPDAGIGIAGPAVDWANQLDLGALAPMIDVYFIMGYGYHWGGSSQAGPNGQLRITDFWRPHISISMQRTLAHYTGLVPAEERRKIVYGVPYYGNEWATASGQIHAATTADGSPKTYSVCRRAIEAGRARQFDEDSQNPWYTYQSGGQWMQSWYEDEESLAAKYEMILEQDLGGTGMWALGYDSGYDELWSLLDGYFSVEPTIREGTRQRPRAIDRFPFTEDNDTRLGPGSYFNAYACAPGLGEYGREWVYQVTLCEPGRLVAKVTDGAGVDVDLQLLDGPIERACLARDDAEIALDLEPGVYLLVADSFVSDHVPQEGEFRLEVDFTPSPTSPGCEPALSPVMPLPLPLFEPIVADAEIPRPIDPPMDPMIPDEGCGCRATEPEPSPLLFALAFFLRRRLRRGRAR